MQEIPDLHADYARREAAGESLPATMHDFPPYRSSILRHPTKNPRLVDPETIELTSPAFGQRDVAAIESDLTIQHAGEPLGERMTVRGRLLDSWGRPLANQLIELWQANSAGRYIHQRDQHPAPLDPNFTGAGRAITNDAGEYQFTTIKPGPVPVEEPPQRLAAGAHPLLGVRLGVHAAAHHPDVLPRRPAVRRSTRSTTASAASATVTVWSASVRPRPHPRPSSRPATGSTSSSTAPIPPGSSLRKATTA